MEYIVNAIACLDFKKIHCKITEGGRHVKTSEPCAQLNFFEGRTTLYMYLHNTRPLLLNSSYPHHGLVQQTQF